MSRNNQQQGSIGNRKNDNGSGCELLNQLELKYCLNDNDSVSNCHDSKKKALWPWQFIRLNLVEIRLRVDHFEFIAAGCD